MSEAERLQKICAAQESELRRLRKMLQRARVAMIETELVENKFTVVVTSIGVDEYHFIEQTKAELMKLISEVTGSRLREVGPIEDADTGEPIEGGVSPK